MKGTWRLRGVAVLMAMTVIGCGVGDLDWEALSKQQALRVLAVDPGDGASIVSESSLQMTFSEPVESLSVDTSTLAILRVDAEDLKVSELTDQLQDQEVQGLAGTYAWNAEGTIVTFLPREPMSSGTYVVVATPQIISQLRMPLNQRPGGSPVPFVSTFAVAGSSVSATDNTLPEEVGSSDVSGTGAGGSETPDVVRNRPASLVINELLYDAVGSDTDGNEFVELIGTPGGDITGYQIVFINGADGKATDTITFAVGTIIPADGIFLIADSATGETTVSHILGADLIENFDPQNGPDCLQLVNEKGLLVDALGYGTPLTNVAFNGKPCFEGTSAAKAASGQALTRTAGADTDDNVSDFRTQLPSPGVVN